MKILSIMALSGLALTASAQTTQTPAIQSVTDLQGRSTTVAPGDPIIIRGTALTANNTGTGNPSWLKVTVGGKAALVRLYRPTEVEAVIPYEYTAGTYPVIVTVNSTVSPAFNLRIAAVAPNLLTDDWSTAGPGMIIRHQATPGVTFPVPSIIRVQYVRPTSSFPAIPGERVNVLVTGLGATNPSTQSLSFPDKPVPLAAKVELVAAGKQMENVFAELEPEEYWPRFREINRYGSILGWARVYFTIPKDMPEGVHNLRITAGGVTGNQVQLIIGKPRPLITAVQTNPGPWLGVCPGAIVSLYGVNFGGKTEEGGFSTFSAGSVEITINAKPAAILGVYEPQGQINVVVPMDIGEGPYPVQIILKTHQGTVLHPVDTYKSLPSIYKLKDPSDRNRAFAIATLANTVWLPIPSAAADVLKIPRDCLANAIDPRSTCAAPVKPGEVLQLYVTGLGLATSDGTPTGQFLETGKVAPADGSTLFKVVESIQVTIGGVSAEVLYSGLAPGFAGLYQVNARVPANARTGDYVPVEITSRYNQTQFITDTAVIAVANQ